MGVTHKAKAGALLTGTEYEAADSHNVSLTAADVGAATAGHNHDGTYSASGHTHDYEASGAVATHAGAADPHTGYRLESADHTHASSGLQGGTVAHSDLAGLTTGDPHTQYRLESEDHTHASSGAQGGTIAHSALTGLTTGDPHTQYVLESDANWVDLTDGGATTLHTHAGGGVTKISGNTGAFVADTTWETLTADSADVTVTTQTTVMTMTGLGSGTYRVKGTLIWKTAATTTGIGITLNHTGTLSQFVSTWWTTTTGGAAATGVADQVTATQAGQLVEGKSERVKDTRSSFLIGTDTAGGTQLSILEAVLIVTATGSLELKIASEVGGSAATLLAGSSLEVNKTA